MSVYTIQKGNTLWQIVKENYGLTNDTDIANKVKEIAKANNILKANSIFAGNNLNLPESSLQKAKETPVTTETSVPKAGTTTFEAKPAKENMGKKFDDWVINGASKLAQGENVEDFAFVGADFLNDLKENDGKNARNIYNKGIRNLSESTVALQDKDKDGTINYEEFKTKELADYKKAFPNTSELPPECEDSTKKAFSNIDLNGNNKIDAEEMAAVYALYDKGIETGENNGKIQMKDFASHSQELSKDGTKDELIKYYNFLFKPEG